MSFGPPQLPLCVKLAGGLFRIEELPRPLLDVLADGDWTAIVPGGFDQASLWRLEARLADPFDPLDLKLLYRAASAVAAAMLGGVPFYAAARMVAAAREHWTLYDGWCLQHGFDPTEAPAHRVVSSIHAWLRSQCQEQKDWLQMEAVLFDPPAGLDSMAGPAWSSAEESTMFAEAERVLTRR